MKTTEEVNADIDAIIDRVGWAIQGVFTGPNDDPGPPFHYTVGLAARELPELIVFGLPMKTGATLLNMLAERMVAGETLPLDTDIDDIAENLPARLITAPRIAADRYMYATSKRYPGYRALQMVWPDRAGRWPWDSDFDARMKPAQPLLRDSVQ